MRAYTPQDTRSISLFPVLLAGLERETSLLTRCSVRTGVTAEGSFDCMTFENPDVLGGSDTSGTKGVKGTLDESKEDQSLQRFFNVICHVIANRCRT